MLDRALAKVFAELVTLLLIACVFTLPLYVGHAIFFRGPLALRELAPDIQDLPEGRQVRGVASSDIDAERRWLLVVSGVALLSIPFVYGAAGRVFEVQGRGAVPTVPDAVTHLSATGPLVLDVRVLAAAFALGAVAWWLVWRLAHLLAGFGPDGAAWLLIGAGRAVAAGAFIALVGGAAAALSGEAQQRTAPEKMDLY